MKKLHYYLPLHFVICLIIGIVIQFYTFFWSLDFSKLFFSFTFLLLLLLVFHQIKKQVLFTITTYLFFFFVGISVVYIQNDKNYSNYYENYINNRFTAVFVIKKVLKSSNYYDKYQAEVSQINQQKSRGSILLNIKKDITQNPLQVDTQIFLKPIFKKIIPPLNPHQFSYKNYLEKQGVHYQVFTEYASFNKIQKSHFSLQGIAFQFRQKIQKSLKEYPFKQDEFTVIKALLLGQRKEISKELISSYSNAGAIHILAISGLHIGILLYILLLLLKPLEKLKNGKVVKIVLIIFLLWSFAFIAGLSASVVRAVTMFTFVAIGQSFQRKQVIEYSLLSSIFFLLLINPMFLFDIGFQLSYLAVFGIVWVQPQLYKLWKPNLKLTDKLWSFFTVSIAVQFGIIPLSLYYFHQFPGLFILSNLLIIPFLGLILIGGIIIMVLAVLKILPTFLAIAYGFVISIMNSFVTWVSHQEQFLFKEISISFLLMLVLYGCIILGFQFFVKKGSKKLLYFLGSIILLQLTLLYEKQQRNQKNEFIVFHKSRESILGKRVGDTLSVFYNLDSVKIHKQQLLLAYKIGEEAILKFSNKTPNIFQINQKKIIVIDSLGIYQLKLKHAIIVLQHSPKINLYRLIKKLRPTKIIADGSNYKNQVLIWQKICLKNKIPFYYTGSKGAIIIK